MNFIINHVRQLDHVHDTNGYFTFKSLTSPAIIENRFTVTLHAGFFHRIEYVIFVRTVKYRCSDVNSKMKCCHTKMDFKHLTDVHP
ncbi:hypothetical protein D3C77_531180 [compost metagenome]